MDLHILGFGLLVNRGRLSDKGNGHDWGFFMLHDWDSSGTFVSLSLSLSPSAADNFFVHHPWTSS